MYRQPTNDKHPLEQHWLPTSFFVLLLLTSVLLRVTVLASNTTTRHDDAISYLVATGHVGDYREIEADTRFPIGTWTEVEDWMQFLTPDGGLHFGKILYDLSHYDIHPPLYFWLLHLWLKLTGVNVWTGPLLNLILDAITATILLHFSSAYVGKRGSLGVAALWLLHPFTLDSAIWTRHYGLVTLIGVAFTLLLFNVVVVRKVSPTRLLVLLLLIAAGLLTNYLFVFWLATAIIIAVVAAWRSRLSVQRILAFLVIVAILAGIFALIAALFPDFLIPLSYYLPIGSESIYDLSSIDFLARSKRLLLITLQFFGPFALVLLLILIGSWERGFAATVVQGRQTLVQQPFLAHLFVWMASFTVGLWLSVALLYVSGISPAHAMGAKYLVFVTPYLALSSVIALIAANIYHTKFWHWLAVGILLIDAASAFYQLSIYWTNASALTKLHNAQTLVLNNVEPGIWPAVLLHLPTRDAAIFAADQEDLLRDVQLWLPRFCQDDAVLVTTFHESEEPTGDREAQGALDLTALIHTQCNVTLTSQPLGRAGVINYEIHYKTPADGTR